MKSYFFNAEPTTDLVKHPSGYDRAYDADDHAAFFAPFLEEAGVLGGKDRNACQIYVRARLTLGIRPGAAYVGGRLVVFDGSETVTAFNGCRIVARMNKSVDVRAFQLLAVTELVRTDAIYDLELAQVAVSGETVTATDTRTFLVSAVRPPVYVVAVSLTAAGWSNKSQTITVQGVQANELKQLIQPAPAAASSAAYYNAGIRCSGQAANRLTFTADAAPTANLTVYVVIQELEA